MRLTDRELSIIRETFHEFFSENDHLWLFGSRVSNLTRCGDIDLYIETMNDDKDKVFTFKLNFIVRLKKLIGDQRIDVVINIIPDKQDLPIYQRAKETGIQIV